MQKCTQAETCRHADMQTCRCADVKTCRSEATQASRQRSADMKTYRHTKRAAIYIRTSRQTDGQDRLADIPNPGNPAAQTREPAPGNTQTNPGIRSAKKVRHSPKQAQKNSEAATSVDGPHEAATGRSQSRRLRSVGSIVQNPRPSAPELGRATEAPLVAYFPETATDK